jgi:ABC-2 type transport system permease protein
MRIFPLLFIPNVLSFKNSITTRRILNRLPFVLLGVIFWLFIYIIFSRILIYFKGIEVFGDILSAKLLSMVFLSFLSFLVMSNIITALSTFYLSRDVEFLLTVPVDVGKIQFTKTIETFLLSSWMVMSFALPVLIAYGNVYKAGFLYYLGLPFIFISFLLLPTGIGITVTHILARILPARNARDIIMILGIIFFLAFFLLFRFLQPEKFLKPEAFPTLLEYLTSMGTDSVFTPYYWITQALLPLLNGEKGDAVFYTLVLISNAAFFMLIASWSGSLFYRDGINKSLGSKRRGIRFSSGGIFSWTLSVLRRVSGASRTDPKLRRALMVKDIKIFLRDNSQWPQLLLLLALVVIYLYNFKVLPLDLIPEASFIVSNFIAFFNLILAGFVLSAIAARFLFPAVSLEGQAFWVIKASPVTMKDFLHSKLISGLLLLIILSEILVFATNLILHIKGIMMLIPLLTILLMTLAIGGLGIGLGAVYPRFEYNNIASISMGFGGFLFMILALFSVILTVLFEAWPLYLYLSNKIIGKTFGTWGVIQTCISFMIVITINVACFYIPLKIGTRSIEGERWM